MNPVVEEMMAVASDEVLAHYGIKRRSGRYPWGSGEDPYQRNNSDFLTRYAEFKKKGMTEVEIARELGLFDKDGNPSTGLLRKEKTYAKDERKILQMQTAQRLKEKEGLGATEIGRRMGLSESTVRGLLDPGAQKRAMETRNVADFIRKQIDEKGMIDVGAGVENELGISKVKLDNALYVLQKEGYPVYNNRFEQQTNPGKWTTQKVICPPGTPYKKVYELDKIHALNEDNYYSDDGGNTFRKLQYPKSMDSKRMMIRYADDVGPDGATGNDKDGIVELRRGVPDLSLGNDRYSQVRILVDDHLYIKGMAVYSDDMPDGVDVIFNTNKGKHVPMEKVLKEIKNDPDNPFGSLIKANGQSTYINKDGNEQLSLINKRASEGDWTEWTDALPSQFLGKQSESMIKKQLGIAKADREAEYEAICSLTNPTIKKHFLKEFSDGCDAAAENLKAAALPGQKYHVIVPDNTLGDHEVYAPRYPDGTKVALIRYPHGGTFEIPILKVNNKNKSSINLIGRDTVDAVCINKKNADKLSGADFDGDTVMVIPTHDRQGKVKITATDTLKGLEGFDPKDAYPEREGMKYMTKAHTQKQMGVVSNLITDMTLAGANEDELARAVRHSMVVIDAHKHKLDYTRSEVENGIAELKQKYQDGGGASTILSRAKGQQRVPKRQGTPKINIKGDKDYDPTRPEGALLYKTADDAYYEKQKVNRKTGEITTTTKTRWNQPPSTQMAETDDARTLMSDPIAPHPKEVLYADYANSMKTMANTARIEMVNTGNIEYSKSANETYKAEVSSLMAKLNEAEKNRPRERAAQRMTNVTVEAKIKDAEEAGSPLSKEDIRKEKQRAISANRAAVSSASRRERDIEITDREWEAIQAGAIHESQLKRILNNTDTAKLKERAMPKEAKTLTPAKVNKIVAMSASNTAAQIAEAMGISVSAVYNVLKEEKAK